jgi:photosystem II stability/assembly factor-like uncharacterized protein
MTSRARIAAVLAMVLAAGLGLGGMATAAASRSAREAPRANSPTELDSIAFFNVHDGYGVFVNQGAHKCTARVGATDDAGATFPVLTSVASWPCAGNATVSALAFDDHGDGFLYGPDLYVSHDSGASWQRVRQPGAVLSVEALGYSIWMLETTRFGPDTGFAGHRYRLRLLESSNGGNTWTAVTVPGGAFVWSGDDVVTGLLTRVSLTSAYVAGVSPQVGNRTEQRSPLYFTSNSGESWSNRSAPCMEFKDPMLSVTPGGSAFFECASEPGAGMQQKDTYRSVNGGVTWQMRSGCPNDRCTKGTPVSGYVNEIDAVSSGTVYLVGARSPLERTTDGGIDWRVVEPQISSGDAGGTSQVIFFSASDGIVLGDGNSFNAPTLYATVDGGQHWTMRVPRLGTG